MNERVTPRHETGGENLHLTEQVRANLERAQDAAEQAEAHGGEHSLEKLKQQVQDLAVSGPELNAGEREAAPASHTFGAHKALKAQSYKQTLSHIRSKLSLPEKSLSKHIHSKRAEKIDSIAEKTVARPWGLLAGGLCAFVGSLIVIATASHYGFRYNFSVFLVLFFGGYAAGTILELLGKFLKRNKS